MTVVAVILTPPPLQIINNYGYVGKKPVALDEFCVKICKEKLKEYRVVALASTYESLTLYHTITFNDPV